MTEYKEAFRLFDRVVIQISNNILYKLTYNENVKNFRMEMEQYQATNWALQCVPWDRIRRNRNCWTW
jgi:hypothetical protein